LVARGVALLAAVAVSLLAVSGAGGSGVQTPKRGGTLVMGTLREPPCLNAFLQRCHGNIPPAGLIMNVALRGAFKVGARFTWEYDLVSGVDYRTRAPFTLTYHIRPEARWSDGVAITAQDFDFTHDTLQKLPEGDRVGLGLEYVRSVEAVDTKTVRVVLRSRYAGWRRLFSNVLPRHALSGEDFSRVWLDGVNNPKTGRPIGSGPFLIEDRERGQALTFVRNPRYWGARRAHLDRIVLRFCQGCFDMVGQQIEWLRDRELDLVMFIGPSGAQVESFRRLPGVRVSTVAGPIWEHVDIRMGPGGHPALKRKQIRRALAYGIDRAAVTRALYGSIASSYPPSQSAAHFSFSSHYSENWRAYRHRPDEARRLLAQEGCRRGDDGIYVCGGERLSFRFVTDADPIRERVFGVVRQQLARIGIEVRAVYAPWQAYVNQILLSGAGDFDLVLFSWIDLTPGRDSLGDLYGCGGRQNLSGYCQRLVNRDLDQARRILDDGRRARVLNRADAAMAKDVPVIPLFERPLFAAHTTSVQGVNLSTRAWNPFANAEDWWLAE
jgi:peptide/nickel transport system substrate-binding protein